LRKPETLKTARDIDKEEWRQIDEDLKVVSIYIFVSISIAYLACYNKNYAEC